MKIKLFIQNVGISKESAGSVLLSELERGHWTQLDIATAFARFSGVRHFSQHIHKIAMTGKVRIAVGLDMGGTSVESLKELLASVEPHGSIYVFHDGSHAIFHPKIYLLSNRHEASGLIGSSNLTESGLFSNYEANVHFKFDLKNFSDRRSFYDIQTKLTPFFDVKNKMSKEINRTLIKDLEASGQLLAERYIATSMKAIKNVRLKAKESRNFIPFGSSDVEHPPDPGETFTSPVSAVLIDEEFESEQFEIDKAIIEEAISTAPHLVRGFVMTLQKTDVGIGQTTPGTSRRSPEIFVPLSARDYCPDFWGWPDNFIEDKSRKGKFDRPNVTFKLGTQIISVTMMAWPVKHDFRLRSEALRSAGEIDDIIKIEKALPNTLYEYIVTIIPKTSIDYNYYLHRCSVSVGKNSRRKYGYL